MLLLREPFWLLFLTAFIGILFGRKSEESLSRSGRRICSTIIHHCVQKDCAVDSITDCACNLVIEVGFR